MDALPWMRNNITFLKPKREYCGEETIKCASCRMQRVLPALCPGHDMGTGGCRGSSQIYVLDMIWELGDAEGPPSTVSWTWCGRYIYELTGAVASCVNICIRSILSITHHSWGGSPWGPYCFSWHSMDSAWLLGEVSFIQGWNHWLVVVHAPVNNPYLCSC